MITGLNHLTLAVSDLDRAVRFYTEALGFSLRRHTAASAYLEAGTLWLALVKDPEIRREALPEYSHAAFSVSPSDLPFLIQRLQKAKARCWQETERPDSYYFLDPDNHKLELHSSDLPTRLRLLAENAKT